MKKAITIKLTETDAIFAALKKSDEVRLPRIGKIKRTKLPKRTGYNPVAKEHQVFPASFRVVFTPSKPLKAAINGGQAKKKAAKKR